MLNLSSSDHDEQGDGPEAHRYANAEKETAALDYRHVLWDR